MPASFVLRVCGHVTPTGKGHVRSRLAPLVRAVVYGRGFESGIVNRTLATVVRWACDLD